ncbi:MAG TPA: hypothetical protein VHB97_21050, partial [Polyangia bacterium]|nr:hypothetical protein [Polyangia bacterium]
MIRRIFLVLALAAAGCGGGSPGGGNGGSGGTGGGGTGGTGGGSGAAADLAMPADMATGGGFCGGATCGGGTTCCVVGGTPSCMSSCPDGGLSAQCQKPSDCPGATAACCITINNYQPQSVMCSEGSQCMPNISIGGMGQDRACVTTTDCTDNMGGTSLPDCCTSTQSGQHVCFSKSLLMMYPQQLG